MTDIIARGGKSPPRQRRARANEFTKTKQQRFCDALALTCNVKRAAEHAGINYKTAYIRRKTDPAFAACWQEAVVAACDRLELLILEHGGAGGPLEPADGERAAAEGVEAPFDFTRAVTTLKLFRSQREGRVLASAGHRRRVATREELAAALTKALAAVKRGLEKEAPRDD